MGVLLIATSVLLGAWAVDGAKQLSVAYVARETIVAGQTLTQDQLRAVDVNLGQQATSYLTIPLEPNESVIASATIRAGELIPKDTISSGLTVEQRIVAVHSSTALPKSIKVGSVLDLWVVSTPQEDGEGGAPQLVVSGLTVSELPDSDGGFSSSTGQNVHLVVEGADIPKVLDVSSPGYTLALLAQPGDR